MRLAAHVGVETPTGPRFVRTNASFWAFWPVRSSSVRRSAEYTSRAARTVRARGARIRESLRGVNDDEDDSALDRRRVLRGLARGPLRRGEPGHRRGRGRAARGVRRRPRPRRRGRPQGSEGVGQGLARQAHRHHVQDASARPGPPGRDGQAHRGRARQELLRRDRRDPARPRDSRLRHRDQRRPQGRVLVHDLHRRGHPHPASARRRRRRHLPLQLPRHGAHVDASAGHRDGQRLHPQAGLADAVGSPADRRALQGGRPAGRRLQRRVRRPPTRDQHSRAPRHRRHLLRRLDAGRPHRPGRRHHPRQARPGARRREQPRDRHA